MGTHGEVKGLGDSAEEIAEDIGAIERIDAVPTLLRVLCDSTGMGFAAVRTRGAQPDRPRAETGHKATTLSPSQTA